MAKNLNELYQKLWNAQIEYRQSGPVHRRDVARHIQRLRAEIIKAQKQKDNA